MTVRIVAHVPNATKFISGLERQPLWVGAGIDGYDALTTNTIRLTWLDSYNAVEAASEFHMLCEELTIKVHPSNIKVLEEA